MLVYKIFNRHFPQAVNWTKSIADVCILFSGCSAPFQGSLQQHHFCLFPLPNMS